MSLGKPAYSSTTKFFNVCLKILGGGGDEFQGLMCSMGEMLLLKRPGH